MSNKKPLQRIFSLVIVALLILSGIVPVLQLGNEQVDTVSAKDTSDNEIKQTDWVISGTVYVNDSQTVDRNIIIESTGELHVNNATITLLIDGYNPWEVMVKDGGKLKLWNSTLKTRPEEALRPFVKTRVTATNGSKITMKHDSSFRFPGWVNIDDSELVMKRSSFDKLSDIPDYDYLWDDSGTDLNKDDNDDCPMLTVKNGSDVYMEESNINNYYENTNMVEEMEWYPYSKGADDNTTTTDNLYDVFNTDNSYYKIETGEVMHFDSWNLSNPMMAHEHLSDYPYMNPYWRISSLHVEVSYNTTSDFDNQSVDLIYNTSDGWKSASNIEPHETDSLNTLSSNIWEIELDEISLNRSVGEVMKNLEVKINNTDDNGTIQIDDLNLASAYENDLDIRNSDVEIIDSRIDIDFNSSDIDPTGDIVGTDKTTYLQDSKTQHRVIRMINSSLKAYGLRPSDPSWEADGDPAIIADETSENQTWIYRWAHLKLKNYQNMSIPNADIKVSPNNNITTIDNQVENLNEPWNNSRAWDYFNRSGLGSYDAANDTYTTNQNGEVTIFLTSDRLNYPEDWPNSKFVGNYELNITYEGPAGDMSYQSTEQISLSNFPNLTASANHDRITFTLDYLLPDLVVNQEDLEMLVNGSPVSSTTIGREVKLNLTVHNQGEISASDINVSFYLDSLDNASLIDNISIASLPSGSSTTVNVTWTPQTSGDHTIIAAADPPIIDEIAELNETNNVASQDITISERSDLVVNDISFDPSDNEMNGTQVDFYAFVSNFGGVDVSDANVSFYAGGAYLGRDIVDLPAGDSTFTTDFTWDYPGVGTYDITAEIDPNNETYEFNESNNVNTEILTINSEPDLAPVDFTVSENNIREGKTLQLETRVENQGGWTSDQTNVKFYVDMGEDTEEVIATRQIGGLDPGESSSVISVSWTTQMSTDQLNEDRDISVSVNDPMDETDERVTDNNVDSKTVTIYTPAELIIDRQNITFSADRLVEVGDTITITSTVKNTGGENVETDVSFFDGEPSQENMIGQNMVTINSDSSAQTSLSWTPETRGNHEIYVVADYTRSIYENDEDNNNAHVTKPIFSENKEYDLIVNDDNSPYDISGTYGANGFVVVEEGGTLSIEGDQQQSQFEMIMNTDNRYSVIVRDQGELIIDDSLIFSENDFEIILKDDAELNVRDESRIYNMVTIVGNNNSQLSFTDSTIEGELDITSDTFTATDSSFTSGDIFMQPSNIDCKNTSFQDDLGDFHDTTGELTAVETGEIDMTGDSKIEIHRWVRVNAMSNGSLPINGAEVTASNELYTNTKVTGDNGFIYMEVLTDVLTPSTNNFVGNYEFTATYTEDESVYTIEPFGVKLPDYPSQQFETSVDVKFDDLFIPDLSVSGATLSANKTEMTLGSMVRLNAEIYNGGDTDAQDVTVEFYLIEDGSRSQIGTDTIDTIEAKSMKTGSIDWEADMMDEMASEESKTIVVRVNPDVNPVDDAHTANNEAQMSILVKSPPRPEFTSEVEMYKGTMVGMEENLTERDEPTLAVHIANTGGTYLENASVNFYLEDELIATNVTSFDPGQELNVTANWLIETRGENLSLEAEINSTADDPLPITRTITIEPLELRFQNLQLPSGEQSPGSQLFITGKLVRSQDDKEIENMDITVYLRDSDGNPIDNATTDTSSSGDFTLTITTPQESGNYDLSLEADHPEAEETTQTNIDVSGAEGGIPLLWIVLIAVLIAAGVIIGMILWLRYTGPAEYVECGNCNATIPADTDECPKCGVDFEKETVKCSECGEWIPADAPECPSCGTEFVTTGKEIEDYEELMQKQYEKFKDKQKDKAKEDLGEDFTEDEFMEWWEDQPSYMTFDDWLEREQERRTQGGIECPECGAINSPDAAICEKCGSTLIHVDEEEEEEPKEMKPAEEEETEEEAEEETEEETEEPEKKQKKVVKKKKVKKQPKKVKKKKVKEEDEEEEE